MKKITLLFIFLFIGMVKFYGQGWDWMKPLGYIDTPYSEANLTSGSSGNLLIRYLSTTTLPMESDLILCNSLGDTLWEKKFQNLWIEDVCLDSLDNIYFSGTFIDTLILDGIAIISNGNQDAIVGKLNYNGNYIDHVSFGTSSSEAAYSLALKSNKLFVTGTFASSFGCDGFSFTASGFDRTFLMKFDSDFNLLKTFQTDSCYSYSRGLKINVDQNGFVYIIGKGNGFICFDSATINLVDGQFLAKFSNDLEFTWVRAIINHWTYGSYFRTILFDQFQNLLLLHRTGGGGGATYYLKVEKFNPSGIMLSATKVPVNVTGYMDVDTSDNVWVAGRGGYYGPTCFSICKVSPMNVVDTIIYDNLISHEIKGLAVKNNNDFYILGRSVGGYLGPYASPPSNEAFVAHYYQGILTNTLSPAYKEKIEIYPNPSVGIFTIQIDNGSQMQVPQGNMILVFDQLGNCVLRQQLSNSSAQQIDISKMAKGIYFVEVETGKERINKKIVLN